MLPPVRIQDKHLQCFYTMDYQTRFAKKYHTKDINEQTNMDRTLIIVKAKMVYQAVSRLSTFTLQGTQSLPRHVWAW